MDNNFTLDLADEAATLAFGSTLGKAIIPNLTIYLHGDLGAGKTTLVRGLLQGLGFSGKVKSPTYTLVEPYENLTTANGLLNLYHFDLYRFNDEEEWESAGFRDYFNAESVCLIEWPEKAEHILPMPDIDIYFKIKPTGRDVHIDGHSLNAHACVKNIKELYS
ncbi:tRNA (adenosine(37)-N6)-threonylcarbamoyltransferase complex ATPase subunit type 1 TsaE [Methylotenera sp.]|jgi:tRNA threonylcarbamoyladenosine biosynthesis protein TsaE|uniref:tRNA (adenosine(37)-N6)-threonylcarbamoyltransferase complex ATPase subunit type 1 TsaE n=1 Tax=Methylotenera sp. TaxID=2051956 RepID=UPI002736E3ED|nr:tRNA (adenosine(37)-N6)-threonylcarbamoyltransferase complex ATPase subunit type 1 TsaE [Methylotenera sp.]MDP3211777.1 tRNA (adenosine(37)-N6)-threonylcarbamoyltransferase complex ATPase subunit type 1 TsaE [Methylotenera sp.]